MLRIAICDDEHDMVSSHKKVIEGGLRECNEMGEIKGFLNTIGKNF